MLSVRCIPSPSLPGTIPGVPMSTEAARSSGAGPSGVSGASVKRSTRIPPSGPNIPNGLYSPKTCSGVRGKSGTLSNPQMLVRKFDCGCVNGIDFGGYASFALSSDDSLDLHLFSPDSVRMLCFGLDSAQSAVYDQINPCNEAGLARSKKRELPPRSPRAGPSCQAVWP